MRILYIDHYVGSLTHGMEFRPYYMAREWVKQGHEVTMVGASEAHVRSRQPEISGTVTEQMIDGIRYLWLKTPKYQENGPMRLVNMVSFVGALYRQRGRFVDWRPDAVIASSTYPWDIYPAHSIARRANAKLVFELHDLWPLSPIEIGGMSPRHPFIIAVQHGEDYACKHSDTVVSILPFANRHLETRGMAPSKYVHVPNGIDLSEWDQPHQPEDSEAMQLVRRLKSEGKFAFGYAGSHSPGNALDTLVDAAAQLDDPSIAVVLVGDGPSKPALRDQAQRLGLKNIHFAPPVKKRDVPALLRAFDALYYGLIPSPLYRFGVSANKLFDYMAAERPFVQSNDAANDLVSEANCGVTIAPGDAKAAARAILGFAHMSPQQRAELGGNGARFVRARHDHKVLAAQFLEALRK